jgi:hypothetical protein
VPIKASPRFFEKKAGLIDNRGTGKDFCKNSSGNNN